MMSVCKMVLKQYLIRLEEWQITELEQRTGKNPVAPLIRSIIGDWLGLDETLRKEQIINEIEGLNGQINLLNQQLHDIDTIERTQQKNCDIEFDRQKYIESNQYVFDMYKNKTISTQGYKILINSLGFNNKDEVNAWLDEQTSE